MITRHFQIENLNKFQFSLIRSILFFIRIAIKMFKELAWFSIILSISYLCDGEDLEFRLPRNIIPNKYRIDIYTDIYNNEKSFKYFGLVNINVSF